MRTRSTPDRPPTATSAAGSSGWTGLPLRPATARFVLGELPDDADDRASDLDETTRWRAVTDLDPGWVAGAVSDAGGRPTRWHWSPTRPGGRRPRGTGPTPSRGSGGTRSPSAWRPAGSPARRTTPTPTGSPAPGSCTAWAAGPSRRSTRNGSPGSGRDRPGRAPGAGTPRARATTPARSAATWPSAGGATRWSPTPPGSTPSPTAASNRPRPTRAGLALIQQAFRLAERTPWALAGPEAREHGPARPAGQAPDRRGPVPLRRPVPRRRRHPPRGTPDPVERPAPPPRLRPGAPARRRATGSSTRSGRVGPDRRRPRPGPTAPAWPGAASRASRRPGSSGSTPTRSRPARRRPGRRRPLGRSRSALGGRTFATVQLWSDADSRTRLVRTRGPVLPAWQAWGGSVADRERLAGRLARVHEAYRGRVDRRRRGSARRSSTPWPSSPPGPVTS